MDIDNSIETVAASTPVAVEQNVDIATKTSAGDMTSKLEMKRKRCASPVLNNMPPTKYRQTNADELPQISLDDLCDELLFEIFKNLDTWALLSLKSCNTHFQGLIMDHRFWNCIDLGKAALPLGLLEEILPHAHDKTQTLKIQANPIEEHHDYEIESFNQTLSQVLIIKCPNLTVLELHSVTLDFRILFIKDLPRSLKRLVFSNCNQRECNNMNTFSGMDTYLINLEEFCSEYNSWFKPYYIMALSKLPQLRKLSLRGCIQIQSFVPYGSLAARLGFKTLEFLDLRATPINDSDLQCFNALEKLKVLLLEQPTDVLTEKTSLKMKFSKSTNKLTLCTIENVADCLRKDYEHRVESSGSDLKELKKRNTLPIVVEQAAEAANSTVNTFNYEDDILPYLPINLSEQFARIVPSVTTASTNEASARLNGLRVENDIKHNNEKANENDADNQPSTSAKCTPTLNVNNNNNNKKAKKEQSHNYGHADDDNDDDSDEDDDGSSSEEEQPSCSNKSIEILKQNCVKSSEIYMKKRKLANAKFTKHSTLNLINNRENNLGCTKQARSTRSPTYQLNIAPDASREPEHTRNMVVMHLMQGQQQQQQQQQYQQQQAAGERTTRRNDHFNNINNMMFHPLFWCMLNPGRSPAHGAHAEPHLPIEVHRGRRTNGQPQVISIHVHNLGNGDTNGRAASGHNFATGSGLSIRTSNNHRNHHMPDRGFISDRGVCSFGRPRNQADREIIWIRIAARPVDNSLEHIILRNYKAISDTTLRHLVQCSPNLVYLDVSGTSITLEGIRAFSAEKPTCNVVAHHLRGTSETMLNQIDPMQF